MTNLLDVALVSGLFFLLLAWLRQSLPRHAARRSLLAAPVGGACYLLARELDLVLLRLVLETGFIVALVAMVVVYQADIRRLLERAFAGRPATQPSPGVEAVVAEAVTILAAQRIGALIAFRGREPWAVHQQGGVELSATVSVPLLCSVFDPHSPGHDGALLIEGDRAARFAVHVPLAVDLPDVSRFGGTRHAAALGLAQACDALVIVVSEETGGISVAEHGTLQAVAGPDDLRTRLAAFRQRATGLRSVPPRGLTPAVQTALASIALTSVLWLAFVYSPDTVIRSFDLPVAIRNLPDQWALIDPLPTTVRVDLAGAEPRLRNLDPEALSIALDLSAPRPGKQVVSLGAANLALPPGIEARRLQPDVLEVDLQETRVVSVPIVVPTIGTPPNGLVLVTTTPVPDTVALIVPVGADPPARVLTEPLDLRTIAEDGTVTSRLALRPGMTLAGDAVAEVAIEIDLRERDGTPTM